MAGRWMGSWLGLGVMVLSLASEVPRARACDWSPVYGQLVSETVPPAGPIVFGVSCIEDDFCDAQEPPATVTDASGGSVAGTTQYLRGQEAFYLVFIPDEPLAEKGRYGIQVDLPYDTSDAWPVSVDASLSRPEAVAIDDHAFMVSVRERSVGKPYCCPTICFAACFTEEVIVEADLNGPAELPLDPFVFFRFVTQEADGSRREGPYRRGDQGIAGTFTQQQDTLCATFEVLDLLRGETQTQQVCRAAPDGVTLGERVGARVEPDQMLGCGAAPTARDCDEESGGGCETPAFLMEAYCAAKRDHCVQSGICDTRNECGEDGPMRTVETDQMSGPGGRGPGGPGSEPGSAQASPSAGAPGPGHPATQAHGEGGQQEDDQASAGARHAKACSVFATGRETSAPALPWLLLLLAASWRLRRTPHARRKGSTSLAIWK